MAVSPRDTRPTTRIEGWSGTWLGDSDMARRVLAFDWSTTALGPLEGWPRSLRTAVATCLHSGFQMAVYWGPQLICIYNDAERDVLGDLHPTALGLPARGLLHDSWDVVGPQLRAALEHGETTWVKDHPLRLDRRGVVETGYFTYSYSPIADDDGGIGGVLLVTEETTGRVLAERRIDALRQVASRSIDAKTEPQACALAAQALDRCPDVAFILTYLPEEDGQGTTWLAASRLPEGLDAPSALALDATQATGDVVAADLFVTATSGARIPRQAFVAGMARDTADPSAGFVVLGISDDFAFDIAYRSFLTLLALGIGRSVAGARAREAERERTRAIAALESARTRLFSDASHELRTPLALILGALEQLVEARDVSPSAREPITVARRSAMRMLKLVNALLDFSRIEAGEQIGAFQPTDLPRLTRDVVAMFRSTAERAGLALSVDCPPLDDPVFVDGEAWERIVSNLLSNAVKFTPQGTITVRVRREQASAVLTVQDTGIGVAPENLERIFQRFGRVTHPSARTSEGSGIGLALVRELAHMHGGSVEARSRSGEGTCMIVRVPLANGHLSRGVRPGEAPRAVVGDAAAPFVAEADGWLDRKPWAVRDLAAADRVLIVEDNADMRAYLQRLLASDYSLESASDGLQGLEMALADPPTIVISDVMIPGLDGVSLLEALRKDARTRDTPVILVSARADPESALRAFELGADDYIVKPFGARELLARVRATVHSTRLRTVAGEARGRAEERAFRERELQALLDDLKAAQRRGAAAGDAERRRIERDLHDGAQQRLMAIRLELGLLAERLNDDGAVAPAEVTRLRGDLEEALDELRELAHGLVPPLLASDGLYAALSAAARRSSVPVEIEGVGIGRLPAAVENAAYFCCAEALQNVTKHAGAGARASVRLQLRHGALEFCVTDDGAGFDQSAGSDGHGLTNLRDRLGALGGHAEITSAPGEGTTVSGQIPLP